MPAKLIEDTVITIIKTQLPKELPHRLPQPETITAVQTQKQLLHNIQNLTSSACFLSISRVDLAPDRISITLNPKELVKEIGEIDKIEPITITTQMNLKKRGVEQKIIIDGQKRTPDQRLIQNLATAHLWQKDLKSGKTIKDIANESNKSTAYVRTRIQLATLSPKIQKAILTGQQPPHLTTDHIIKSNMPKIWQDQEQSYGFK